MDNMRIYVDFVKYVNKKIDKLSHLYVEEYFVNRQIYIKYAHVLYLLKSLHSISSHVLFFYTERGVLYVNKPSQLFPI